MPRNVFALIKFQSKSSNWVGWGQGERENVGIRNYNGLKRGQADF